MKTRSISPGNAIGRLVVLIALAILAFSSNNVFAQTPVSLNVARQGHTATVLADGRVLVFGGDAAGSTEATAEFVDVAAGTSTPVALNGIAARTGHTATRLADGRVLIAGGSESGVPVSSTFFIDAAGSVSPGPNMASARSGHTAVYFSGTNNVLFIGGDSTGTAEVLDVAAGTSQHTPSNMSTPRSGHSSVLMNDGRVLVVGGDGLNTAEIFDGSSFTATGNTMTLARSGALLRTLPDGKVQIIGGNGDGSMEVYDPAIDTIGAYAHVIPSTDYCVSLQTGVKSSQTRAALFGANIFGAPFDRTGAAIVELGSQALIIGGSNGGTAITSIASSNATVTTDKLDYAPGETATITGTGFGPNETINIVIHEDPKPSTDHIERKLTTTSDATGNFTISYQVEDHDLNLKFILNARGATSGTNAQTTFTDGGINVKTVGTGSTPSDVAWARFANATCAGTPVASGTISAATNGNGTPVPLGTSSGQSVRLTSLALSGFTFVNWTGGVPSPPNTSTSICLADQNPTRQIEVNFNAGKLAQTVTFGALANKTYGAADFTVSATATSGLTVSFAASGNCNVTGTTVHITGAGSCTITASQAGNAAYNAAADVSQSFTINKANATVVVTPYDVTYDGQPHTATATITGVNSEAGATVGTVDLNGTTHTDAGTYNDTWTFTGTANYNNIAATAITNKIAQATQAINVTAAAPATAAYGSKFTVTATGGNSTNSVVITASGVCTGGGNGTAEITMTSGTGTCTVKYNQAGNNNYSAAPEVTSSTSAEKAALIVTASSHTVTYGDTAPTVSPSFATFVSGDTAANTFTAQPVCSTTYTAGSPVSGTYTTSCKDAASDKYSFNYVAGTVTVNKANAVITVTPYSVTYDGQPHTATGSAVGAGGENLTSLLDLSLTTHTNAGTYSSDGWSFAGDSNHNSDSGTVNNQIDKAAVSATAGGGTSTYDGSAKSPSACIVTGTFTGSLNCSNSPNTVGPDAGTYTIDPAPGGDNLNNFNITSVQGSYKIEQADANVVVNGFNGVYDGTTHGATGTATGVGNVDLSAGLNLGQTFTNVPGGTAHWTFDGGTNYKDEEGDVEITIAPKSLTATVDAVDRDYDDTNIAMINGCTFPGIVGDDAVVCVAEGFTALFADQHVGIDKPVIVTGLGIDGVDKGNYSFNGTGSGAATITPLAIQVKAVTDKKTYDGNDSSTKEPNFMSLKGNDTGASDQKFDAKHAGTRTLSVIPESVVINDENDGRNYSVTFTTASGSIDSLAIVVKAKADTKVYDGNTSSDELPEFVSLVGGDSGTSTQVFDSKNVGSRTLSVVHSSVSINDGNDGNNYTLSFETASGSISAKPLAASIDAVNKVYDGTTTATFTCSLEGVVSPDVVNCTGGTANFANSNAGIWTVTATGLGISGAGASNYTVNSTATDTAEITKALLTITASSHNVFFLAPVPQITPSYSGFVLSEGPSNLTTQPTCTTTYMVGAGIVGSPYETTCSGATSGNYSFSYVTGTLTVTGYGFDGFKTPIDMSTLTTKVWNNVQAGQAIPSKWRLTLNGIPVSATNSFVNLYSYEVSCSTGTTDVETIVEELASGNSGLIYNNDGNWQYNWKTPKNYAKQCRAMYVQFLDGSKSPVTYFKFK